MLARNCLPQQASEGRTTWKRRRRILARELETGGIPCLAVSHHSHWTPSPLWNCQTLGVPSEQRSIPVLLSVCE